MSDVTLSYKGSDILELSDSGSATLKTGGKYCEGDIGVEYVKPSGGGAYLYSAEENILDGTSFESGFVSANGTISNGSNKEVVSDYIAVTPKEKIYFCYWLRNTGTRWIGIGFYANDNSFITRTAPIGSSSSSEFSVNAVSVPENASKMRVSFRTYGNAEIMVSRTVPSLIPIHTSETASIIIVP